MECTMSTILVTGATGQQGGTLARVLLDHGHTVRALTRNGDSQAATQLKKLGADIFEGNFDDSDSLKRAIDGSDAVYVVSTPFEDGIDAETRQGIAAVDAVNAVGVNHLVYSSVSDADRKTGIPHFDSKFKVEQHIQSLNLPYTIVAPVYFFENMFAPFMLPGLQQGTLALGLPHDRKLQSIAVANIGNFLSLVFEKRDEFIGRRVNIASDELTGEEYAAALSRTSGKSIAYFQIPIEQVREQNEDFALMYEWFDRVGYTVDISSLHRDYPEVGWMRFEDWAQGRDWKVLDRAS